MNEFSGMVWFNMVFDSGLEPNFFGVIATLFAITSVSKTDGDQYP